MELSIVCAYLQGFELMRVADKAEGWGLNLSEIARIWKGGCIIRSGFLKTLEQAYSTDKSQAKAGWEAVFARFGGERQLDWRQVVEIGVSRGVPLPAVSASLSYYDTLLRKRLPQYLIQAQRDFFGAHTYERTDKPGTFHTKWE
jgi:6-phosphogluconate dehydrogenase